MSRLTKEMKLIPRPAWLVALLIYGGLFSVLYFVAIPADRTLAAWPLWAKLAFGGLVGLLLAIFIPNAIGIILYFILRDPLLEACPECGAMGRSNFAFCPHCGRACPDCRRAFVIGGYAGSVNLSPVRRCQSSSFARSLRASAFP